MLDAGWGLFAPLGWGQEAVQVRVGAVKVAEEVAWKPKVVEPAAGSAPL
jgi:hypothetical protein